MNLRISIMLCIIFFATTMLGLSEAGSMDKDDKQDLATSNQRGEIVKLEHVDDVEPCQMIHDQKGEEVALLMSLTDKEEHRKYTISFARRDKTATYRGRHGKVATEWNHFNLIRYQLASNREEGDFSIVGSNGQILISGYIPQKCWEVFKRYVGNEIPIIEPN